MCVLHIMWKVPWLKITQFFNKVSLNHSDLRSYPISVIACHSSTAMAIEKEQSPIAHKMQSNHKLCPFVFFLLFVVMSVSPTPAARLSGLRAGCLLGRSASSTRHAPPGLSVICTAVLAHTAISSCTRDACVPLRL